MKRPKARKIKWIEKRTWESFQNAGMLWFVNRFLHLFGWAIVVETGRNNKIRNVYPARCRFRGFSTKDELQGFQRVSRYIAKHSKHLLKDLSL